MEPDSDLDRLRRKRQELWLSLVQNLANASALTAALQVVDDLIAAASAAATTDA